MSVLQPVVGISGIATNLTTQSVDDAFNVLVGIGQPATPTVLSTLQDARKGGGGITVTVSVPDTSVVQLKSGAQTGASVTVAIPERNSQNTATVSIDPLAAGTTSVSASIPGGVQSTGGSFPNPQSVTVGGTSLRFNASAGDPIRIGAGLEVCQNGNYSVQAYDPATNQVVNVTSATTVTIASSNGTAVLVSPSDTTTVGAASTTVTIPANSNSVLFCVAGASGQAGATSNLTASAGGFGSATPRAVSVLQPVVGISGIATNLTTQSVDDAFNVLVGIGQPATPTVLSTVQDARKGGGGITVTVSVPDTSVVQLKSGAQTGASVTVAIPERNSQNTATVSIDPLAAGTTSVSASIPGGVQSTGGSFPNPQSVTVGP